MWPRTRAGSCESPRGKRAASNRAERRESGAQSPREWRLGQAVGDPGGPLGSDAEVDGAEGAAEQRRDRALLADADHHWHPLRSPRQMLASLAERLRSGERISAGRGQRPFRTADVCPSAGKNDSMASSATVMSWAVPKVAMVLKNVRSPSPLPSRSRSTSGTNSRDAVSEPPGWPSATPGQRRSSSRSDSSSG